MKDHQTLYQLLGVDELATPKEIKSAFRRCSKQTHPDHGGSPAEFLKVRAAFMTLSDELERRAYDAELAVIRSTNVRPSRLESPRTPSTTRLRPALQPRPRRKSPTSGALDVIGAILWLVAYGCGFLAGLGIVGGVADGESPSAIWGLSVLGGPRVAPIIASGLVFAGLSYFANHLAGNHSSIINEETAFGSVLYAVGTLGFGASVYLAFSDFGDNGWKRGLAASAAFGLCGLLVDTAQSAFRREWRSATDYYTRPEAANRLEIHARRTGPTATGIVRNFLRRLARHHAESTHRRVTGR